MWRVKVMHENEILQSYNVPVADMYQALEMVSKGPCMVPAANWSKEHRRFRLIWPDAVIAEKIEDER